MVIDMYSFEMIGRYNVNYYSPSYADGYYMVTVEEFESEDINSKSIRKKRFYFLGSLPEFSSESDIDDLMSYPDNSRLRGYSKIVFERV